MAKITDFSEDDQYLISQVKSLQKASRESWGEFKDVKLYTMIHLMKVNHNGTPEYISNIDDV